MSRKYLLDGSANGAKWADDVHYQLLRAQSVWRTFGYARSTGM